MHRIVTRTRTAVVAAVAVATTFGLAGIAAADDISNNIDAGVDAAAEQMPLNVGGAQRDHPAAHHPTNSDGKNGCNLTGRRRWPSPSPPATRASPRRRLSSNTFTACGDIKTVTVTPVAAGTTTVTVSQTRNTTAGTFNFAPATFTRDVALAGEQRAPGGGHRRHARRVVPEGRRAGRRLRGHRRRGRPATYPATISGDLDADGLGSETATCSYTDAGGLATVRSATYSSSTAAAPSSPTRLTRPTADGLHGWWTGDVILDWTVTETDSPASLVTEGATTSAIDADQLETTTRARPAAAAARPDPSLSRSSATATARGLVRQRRRHAGDDRLVRLAGDGDLRGFRPVLRRRHGPPGPPPAPATGRRRAGQPGVHGPRRQRDALRALRKPASRSTPSRRPSATRSSWGPPGERLVHDRRHGQVRRHRRHVRHRGRHPARGLERRGPGRCHAGEPRGS